MLKRSFILKIALIQVSSQKNTYGFIIENGKIHSA